MNEEEKRHLMGAVQGLVSDAMEENVALRWLCGQLIAEVALLSPSPPDKLGEMVAKLGGAAQRAASESNSPAITRVVQQACAMAEASLVRREG